MHQHTVQMLARQPAQLTKIISETRSVTINAPQISTPRFKNYVFGTRRSCFWDWASQQGPPLTREDQPKFVSFFRQSSPYIEGHRERTFVVVVPGNVAYNEQLLFSALDDVAVVHGLGVRLVLVLGSSTKVEEILKQKGQSIETVGGYKITNKTAMQAAMEASGGVRVAAEAFLSRGPSIPMLRRHSQKRQTQQSQYSPAIRVVSGNYVAAKRRGIVKGVDFEYTGEVRYVDSDSVNSQLDGDNIVILSNLGFNPAGELLFCDVYEVGVKAAVNLNADKLIVLHLDEVSNMQLPNWLSLKEAEKLLIKIIQFTKENVYQSNSGNFSVNQYDYSERHRKQNSFSDFVQESDVLNKKSNFSNSNYGSGNFIEQNTNTVNNNYDSDNGSSNNGSVVNFGGQTQNIDQQYKQQQKLYQQHQQQQHQYLLQQQQYQQQFQFDQEMYASDSSDEDNSKIQSFQNFDLRKNTPIVDMDEWQKSGYPSALLACYHACHQGITRAHLIDARVDGAMLLELYSRDGIGTMISTDFYEGIRKAQSYDVDSIIELLQPLEKEGIIIPRTREQIMTEISDFVVIERENKVLACVQLKDLGVDEEGVVVGEIAAFCVRKESRKRGRGDYLLDYVEQWARLRNFQRLVLLTTRTADWFQQRGFFPFGAAFACELIPEIRRDQINPLRNSQCYVKELEQVVEELPPPGKRIGF